MALVKHGEVIADPWARIENDTLPLGRPLLLTLEEWQRLAGSLRHWDQPLGLILTGAEPLDQLRDSLGHFQLIALAFPKFTDGRAYSQARLLRKRYGFTGELRAIGNVLQDQFLQMHRCGFDSYEVADETAAQAWIAATSRYLGFYQPSERGTFRGARAALDPQVFVAPEQPAAAAWAY